jgi:UDP-glucose 4-epimerase
MKAFVTGGAGFIGSHIVDHLMELGTGVTVYDNLTTGFEAHLSGHRGNPAFQFIRGDILDFDLLARSLAGHDAVFHFQANADVRGGMEKTRIDLEQNTTGTWNVLEAMRVHSAKLIVFASSATVYGEPYRFPTPEDEPLIQTSLYGASKLAGEAMLQAYSEYFGIRSLAFRFVSWIGARYSHGVVFDLMKKLCQDPRRLEVLGDGKQRKSYLDVRDGVSGIFTAVERFEGLKGVFNLGHDESMNVLDLAQIVVSEMGLENVEIHTAGGERGWLGDSPIVHLDTRRIKALGWIPGVALETGIRSTVQHLLENPWLLERQ